MRRCCLLSLILLSLCAAVLTPAPSWCAGLYWTEYFDSQYARHGPAVVAAVASLPETSGVAVGSGLAPTWWAQSADNLFDDTTEVSSDSILAAVAIWLTNWSTEMQWEYRGRCSNWMNSYALLQSLRGMVSDEYLASAITMTTPTRSACRRSDSDLDRLGLRVGTVLENSEIQRMFYDTASLLAALEANTRFTALSMLLANIDSVVKDGWQVD
jgi:hypothetical protein